MRIAIIAVFLSLLCRVGHAQDAAATQAVAPQNTSPQWPDGCNASTRRCRFEGGTHMLPAGLNVQEIRARDATLDVFSAVQGDIVLQMSTTKLHAPIHGDVVVIGGEAQILDQAVVQGDLVIIGGDVQLHGQSVQGDLVSIGKDAKMLDDAGVQGDHVSIGGDFGATLANVVDLNVNDLDIDSDDHGSSITLHRDRDVDFFNGAFWSAARSTLMLSLIPFLLLFALIAPQRTRRFEQALRVQPSNSFLAGVLTSIVGVVTLSILGITIIGLPLALLGVALLTLLGCVGLLASGAALGGRIARNEAENGALLSAGVGLLILTALIAVPYVGLLVMVLASVLGMGAIVQSKFGRDDQTHAENTEIVVAA